MNYNGFCKWWNFIDISTKIEIFKEYCSKYDCSDEFWEFGEEFFEQFSDNPMEICRATVYGDVNYRDNYIMIDAYGNFKTLTTYEAADIADDYKRDIFAVGIYESHIKTNLEYDND